MGNELSMEKTVKRRFFFDTIQNKVDSKCRVCIPAEYREILESKDSTLVAFRSFAHPCIECYPYVYMDMIIEKINSSFDLFSERHDDMTRLFLADAKEFVYDSTGRIVLTEKLLKHSRITDAAVFVGMGEKFQIWSPKIYEEEDKKLRSALLKRSTEGE